MRTSTWDLEVVCIAPHSSMPHDRAVRRRKEGLSSLDDAKGQAYNQVLRLAAVPQLEVHACTTGPHLNSYAYSDPGGGIVGFANFYELPPPTCEGYGPVPEMATLTASTPEEELALRAALQPHQRYRLRWRSEGQRLDREAVWTYVGPTRHSDTDILWHGGDVCGTQTLGRWDTLREAQPVDDNVAHTLPKVVRA